MKACDEIQLNTDTEIVKYLREQRHDFMNHIQVIWGYLQLNKAEAAAKYIAELNKKFAVSGMLFKTNNPVLSLFLYNYIRKIQKFGMDVDLDIDVESIGDVFFFDIIKLTQFLEKIFDEVIEHTHKLKEKIIYIDIYEEDRLYLTVSNYNNADDNFELQEGQNNEELMDYLNYLKEIDAKVQYKTMGDFILISIGFLNREA
ncbi:sensory histidine kinase DcuS [Oxobacter pfennigii]|uniref:Sensory histidine kinase DcuS n=1 Tax=Oxobacter pfennigii TaxID=36849 RepID=A0A0P8X088_9CLOT|nr:Spo0B domain-containing protein [Oxobacter pfennigii]KPU44164.1 sensory histidine kinase DcuS [Oxobacter pfennigii]